MKREEERVKSAHISLDPEVFNIIEEERGLIKRSNYINEILREVFGLNNELEEQTR